MSHRFASSIEQVFLAMCIGLAVAGGAASLADDARRAKVPPSAASLDDALVVVRRIYPGRVLKVELESEDDGPAAWVYDMKVLTRTGRVLEVKLDAVSLKVLEVEGGRSHDSGDD